MLIKVKQIFGGGRWLRYFDPVKYWKRKGCSIGENCEIYNSASFGSEPYLVTIGNK